MEISDSAIQPWNGLQKLLFCFFFLFFILMINPFSFLEMIPGANYVTEYIYKGIDAVALQFNKWFFHITPATKPPNGNGDFPEQWMQVFTFLLLSAAGSVVWFIAVRKKNDFSKLNYWLCIGLRYFLIINGLSYGVIKLLHMQMPHPNLSQLATPLGDYQPMRFSWMFIGYSTPYQFFSGAIEVMAALLLLFRRTATLGVLVALGVFFNVMMLNLSYDIPVKINSIFLVIVCFYLLVQEIPRLVAFFFRNEAKLSSIFVFPFETKKGRRIARVGKTIFIVLAIINIVMIFTSGPDNNNSAAAQKKQVLQGVYDVVTQIKLGDTINVTKPDSVYWQNMVFDKNDDGSIKTADTRFRQRYGRSYFGFYVDEAKQLLTITPAKGDSTPVVQFNYFQKDSVTVELRSYPKVDSLFVLLRKRTKPFPLAEEQFHWISETNR